ncbi:MAG: zinc ribbon domain-containing protein [Erysipelotrichaceae bacterium]|nr:zinc ribbon domain-containing protein [Erysipelotrichaceae bacterium]
MYCVKCGNEMEDGVRYCPKCGSDQNKKKRLNLLNIVLLFIACTCFMFVAADVGKPIALCIAVIQLIVLVVAFLMNRNVLRTPYEGFIKTLIISVWVLFIPFGIEMSIKHYEKLDWPSNGLAVFLPEPDCKYGEVFNNSSDYFYGEVYKIKEDFFENYINECIASGFTIDAKKDSYSYTAYNDEGYKLELSFYDEHEFMIYLDAPIGDKEFLWPNNEMGELVPKPVSNTGRLEYEYEDSFSIYVSNTSYSDYLEYVQRVMEAGFTCDYYRGDDYFYGEDENDNSISVSYEGFNTMLINFYMD